MSRAKPLTALRSASPLTIEELELGLEALNRESTDPEAFWDRNIEDFRQTVLLAIRETSDALLSPSTPLHWQMELERELEELVRYIQLAENYRTQRLISLEPSAAEFPHSAVLLH